MFLAGGPCTTAGRSTTLLPPRRLSPAQACLHASIRRSRPFVLIWSSGFIVGKAVVPHADLQLYLVARFVLTALVMGFAAVPAGIEWPRGRQFGMHIIAGVLMQGAYLCASYWALSREWVRESWCCWALLQPVFTALFAAVRGGKTRGRARGSVC